MYINKKKINTMKNIHWQDEFSQHDIVAFGKLIAY